MFQTTEDFLGGMLRSDPFSSNRVNGPDRSLPTVKSIHKQQFESLCRMTTHVHQANEALGVLLWSGAGVGKSHLLARLCEWADKEEKAFYLYLHNVLVSSENTPRHFLKSVVSMMVEGRVSFQDSPLYEMVHSVMRRIRNQKRISTPMTPQKARQLFTEATQSIPLRRDRLNGIVFKVLFSFFEKVNMNPEIRGPVSEDVNAIVDWLSGDGIDDERAKQIGITPQPSDYDADGLVRLRDNHQVEQIFLILAALCHMAGRALLIVIDQVDNMRESVCSLAEFSHALLDHCQNLLLITAGVKESIKAMIDTGVITEAQRDRIAQKTIDLHPIEPKQARDILETRLRPFQEKAKNLPEVSSLIENHPLFPLAEKNFEIRFGQSTEIQPRSVVTWANAEWENEQYQLQEKGGSRWLKEWVGSSPSPPVAPLETVIDEAVQEALNDLIADRRKNAGMLPPDADNLATVVERLLSVCQGREPYSLHAIERIPGNNPYSLDITERIANSRKNIRTAVAMVASRDGRVAMHPIQRLLEKVPKEVKHRILVTDDERTPLPSTPTINTRYEQLQKLGGERFQHIKLTFQQYVELDALRSAMDDAVNIAIEYPGRECIGLTREEVAESLHRQGRFLSHPLLKELLTEPNLVSPKPAPPPPTISHELIVAVIRGNLGWRISVMTNDITTEILKQPGLDQVDFEQAHNRVLEVVQIMESNNQVSSRELKYGLLIVNAHN